jgi:hypothetical protein
MFFLPFTYFKYIFHVKIQLFVFGSALKLKARSGSALKPMRIHNTAECYAMSGDNSISFRGKNTENKDKDAHMISLTNKKMSWAKAQLTPSSN